VRNTDPTSAPVLQGSERTAARAAGDYVTLVEVLELTRPFEEFVTRRLEAEGVGELVSVQFYTDPGTAQAGAILTFSDRERILEHIRLITGWEEFGRFVATVKPVDVRVYGTLSSGAEAWVRQFGDVLGRKFGEHVAGFVR
jgi:hypothetical protein